MSKMFVHYKGTVAEFKAAKLESTYTNHIVFIKGGEANGNGEAVYTHGQYYANVKDALAALQTKVDGMKYFSKISDGSTTASVASADGTITIKGEDPAIVTVVDKEGVKIGLSDAFKTAVNTTLPNAIDAVEESLGSKEDKADVNGSAFARIANLTEIVSDLTGGSAESVGSQITNAINDLDVDAAEGDYVASISQADGKIVPVMGNFAFDAEGAAAQALQDAKDYADGKFQVAGNYEAAGAAAEVQGNLDTEVLRAQGAEADLLAAINTEKARMDAFMLDADVQGQAVDTLKEIQAYITSDGAAAQEMLAAIEAAQGAADAAQGEVDALEGVVAGVKVTAEAAATKDALDAEILRADAAEKANAAAIKAISDDYLKGADKAGLQGNIDAKVAQSEYNTKIAALEAKDAELEGFWAWEEL